MVQNEAGAVDGRPRVVRPHRDFRLILAMDPRHGEVSRAMRNRGVELCLLPEQADKDMMPGTPSQVGGVCTWLVQLLPCSPLPCCLQLGATGAFGCSRPASSQRTGNWAPSPSVVNLHSCGDPSIALQVQDMEGLLALEGVPGAALPGAMAATHAAAVAASTAIGRPGPTCRELRQWASLARELLQRGWTAREALAVSWRQVCLPRLRRPCRACRMPSMPPLPVRPATTAL